MRFSPGLWRSFPKPSRDREVKEPGRLSSGRSGELLDHRQQQLTIAVVEVGGVAPDLREEAELVVGKLLRLELASQRIFGEQLCERKLECSGDLGESVQ